MSEPKRWSGSAVCDLCGETSTDYFVDGRMKNLSVWAVMCSRCWDINGVGRLGRGYGQKYAAQTLEKLPS